ncbi:MAG: arylamine N-acetyltransferase [Rhizobiaceae bacterium]
MTEFQFDKQAYLRRIGYNGDGGGDVAANMTTLRQLLTRQLYTIPFENFDICLGKVIDLDPLAQFDKLVNSRRGGYCFELNGLLLAALQAIGFEARPLLARVHGGGTVGGRDHQLSLVHLEGQDWIVDSGFGKDTPHCPLPLKLGQTTISNGLNLRLVAGQHLGTLLQVEDNGHWRPMYSFDLEYVGPADIQQSNHFTCTHPSTHFVQRRVAALPTEGGGVTTLSDHRLTIRQNGQQSEIQLPDNGAYLEALDQHFGIVLDADYADLKPLLSG